jgi:hypothetical protein
MTCLILVYLVRVYCVCLYAGTLLLLFLHSLLLACSRVTNTWSEWVDSTIKLGYCSKRIALTSSLVCIVSCNKTLNKSSKIKRHRNIFQWLCALNIMGRGSMCFWNTYSLLIMHWVVCCPFFSLFCVVISTRQLCWVLWDWGVLVLFIAFYRNGW